MRNPEIAGSNPAPSNFFSVRKCLYHEKTIYIKITLLVLLKHSEVGDFLAHEVKYVTQTIEKIMEIWNKDGKRNFTVKVPKSHRIKEFELLLKQMLIHYQVPVKTTVQEVPVEIKCSCGYTGEARMTDPEDVISVLCPNCNKNKGKIISGKDIEVS